MLLSITVAMPNADADVPYENFDAARCTKHMVYDLIANTLHINVFGVRCWNQCWCTSVRICCLGPNIIIMGRGH